MSVNFTAYSNRLLSLHAQNPRSLDMGMGRPMNGAKATVGSEVQAMRRATKLDDDPEVDSMATTPGLVVMGHGNEVLEFQGDEVNGSLKVVRPGWVSQTIFTPDHVECVTVSDKGDKVRVDVNHMDRRAPEESADETYFLADDGHERLRVDQVLSLGRRLQSGDLQNIGNSKLGPNADVIQGPNELGWLLSGRLPEGSPLG